MRKLNEDPSPKPRGLSFHKARFDQKCSEGIFDEAEKKRIYKLIKDNKATWR